MTSYGNPGGGAHGGKTYGGQQGGAYGQQGGQQGGAYGQPQERRESAADDPWSNYSGTVTPKAQRGGEVDREFWDNLPIAGDGARSKWDVQMTKGTWPGIVTYAKWADPPPSCDPNKPKYYAMIGIHMETAQGVIPVKVHFSVHPDWEYRYNGVTDLFGLQPGWKPIQTKGKKCRVVIDYGKDDYANTLGVDRLLPPSPDQTGPHGSFGAQSQGQRQPTQTYGGTVYGGQSQDQGVIEDDVPF